MSRELSKKITGSARYTIKKLKIKGGLNATDFGIIRMMAGRDWNGEQTPGKLEVLDISEVILKPNQDFGCSYRGNSISTDYRILSDYILPGSLFEETTLKSIICPPQIHTLSGRCFINCNNLESVVAPGVREIGQYAFENCINLLEFDNSNDETTYETVKIGKYCFKGCSKLNRFAFKKSKKMDIGAYAFYDCTSLKTICINVDNFLTIGEAGFKNCVSLESIQGRYFDCFLKNKAFENCQKLSGFAPSVEEVGDYCFANCEKIDKLASPVLTNFQYGKYSYSNTGFADLNFRENGGDLGEGMFQNCKHLKTIVSYKSIPKNCFDGCTNLEFVKIGSVSQIGENAFDESIYNSCSVRVPKGKYYHYVNGVYGEWHFKNTYSEDVLPTPTISVDRNNNVSIRSYVYDGTLYYHPEGYYPSYAYSEPFQVSKNTVVSALVKLEYDDKGFRYYGNNPIGGPVTYTIDSFKYNIPTIEVKDNMVTITAKDDSNIYYAINREPTYGTNYTKHYVEPFEISERCTIYAKVYIDARNYSETASYQVRILKLSAPKIVCEHNVVTMSSPEDADIFYTVDGTEPNVLSSLYKEPIRIDKDLEIRAFAVKDEFESSEKTIAKCTYVSRTQTITWGEMKAPSVGETIELMATASSGLSVKYSAYAPLSAFKEPIINVNKATFPQEGCYLLVATQEGNEDYDMVADTLQINVVCDDDELMCFDGIYYKLTASKEALKVVRGNLPYKGKVVIPATVNGMPVVEIENNAMYASYFLTEVTIGENISVFGSEAIGACPNLHTIVLPANAALRLPSYCFNCDDKVREIHCLSEDPYVVAESVFNGFLDYEKCVLYVPVGCRNKYIQAPFWKNFTHIEESTPIIVRAKSYSRQYGDENPVFEFETEGAALDGTPEIVCSAAINTPVGTYTIEVKQGSVKNYNVHFENGTLTVTKVPLTIFAGNYTKKQGDAMPVFKASYVGFKNGEDESVLRKQPAFSCEANETSAPADYAVTVSDAEAENYDISYEQGRLTVTDAVVVRAKSYSRVYGDANPVFEFETEGTVLDGTPEIVCSADKSSQVGSYTIEVRQGSIKNYNVHFENGSLAITKAPLTISAGNYTKKQGDAMPEFKANYTGFKNGEDESVLTKRPTFETTATVESAPGEYPITVYGVDADNYEVKSYITGTLTVLKRELKKQTITWNQEIKAKVGSTIEMNATASSGLPVRYSYAQAPRVESAYRVPQIEGNNITFPEEGTYMLVAIQDGNNEYAAATDTLDVCAISDDEGLMYIDGIYYKYTDDGSALKVVRGYNPYRGKVEIPATVNGLPVTEVDRLAMYACYYLKELVIGDNVKKCGHEAFGASVNLYNVTLPAGDVELKDKWVFNCDRGIREIHCRSSIPYVVDEGIFNGAVDYDKCILYVPVGTKQAYRNAEVWKYFTHIVEENVSTSISNINVEKKGVWYTLQGVKLFAKPNIPGVYIHNGKKIIVR